MNGMNGHANGGGNDRLFDKIEQLEAENKQLKEQLAFVSCDRNINRIRSMLDIMANHDADIVYVGADDDRLVIQLTPDVVIDQLSIDALNSIGCHNQTSSRIWELSL